MNKFMSFLSIVLMATSNIAFTTEWKFSVSQNGAECFDPNATEQVQSIIGFFELITQSLQANGNASQKCAKQFYGNYIITKIKAVTAQEHELEPLLVFKTESLKTFCVSEKPISLYDLAILPKSESFIIAFPMSHDEEVIDAIKSERSVEIKLEKEEDPADPLSCMVIGRGSIFAQAAELLDNEEEDPTIRA